MFAYEIFQRDALLGRYASGKNDPKWIQNVAWIRLGTYKKIDNQSTL